VLITRYERCDVKTHAQRTYFRFDANKEYATVATKTKIYVAKGKENPTVATMALIPDDTDVVPIFTT
jgi:hypothetical protein